MPFSISNKPDPSEVSDAVNYLLANFAQVQAVNPNSGQITTSSFGVVGYLYKYLNVKYADSFDGQLNFSNSPTNRLYYGLRNNDSSVESTLYSDYVWTEVPGGFGTTKFFWYATSGGRQIQTTVATTAPAYEWAVDPGTAIDLDLVTLVFIGVDSFSAGTTGFTPSTPTTGAVVLAGTLKIANGGTNSTSVPTAGAVPYGTGTAYAFTSAGTAGQVLTSAGAGVPTWTTNASGDVFGPASSTDNAVARFDGTTGKLIQNSVVTISDTGATTGVTTLSASTSVTTPIVQASNSAGLSLKNASGTTQMSVGAGGGDNMSVNVSTNLNGTNAQIDISPTGTGHVHIKPTGTGSVEVAPTNVGTIDNMTIGATTPKNASFVDLSVTGTTSFDGAQGTSGQVLTSAGTGNTPTWTTPTTGTVTAVSVVSANGLAGTVATSTTTPAITLSTTITGLLKGNGTAISAATANTDYMGVAAPVTKTTDFTVANGDIWYINNKSGSTCTVTLPAASSWTGRSLTFKNMQAQTLVSASSNVMPLDSTTAGTAILLEVVGNWATLVSDGTNWVIMQAASNNNLLLE